MTEDRVEPLGMVVGGSLEKGLEVKLEASASVEDMAVGRYVAIAGRKHRFFGMISDIALGAIDPRLTVTPPEVSDPFVAEVLRGTATYGILRVVPTLILGPDAQAMLEGPQPVKTVPEHFSYVWPATEQDIERVFGGEDQRHLWIGNPLDMETKVCLDLEEFVKRSNGIFGKSGTGKTFFTRLLLIGLVQREAAVSLIFDMHNEYGWEGSSEAGRKVKALKQLFPTRVAVFALDEESARRRQVSYDHVVEIGYGEIEPEDVELLRSTLNLTESATQATYRLARRYGERWLEAFLDLEGREALNQLAGELGEHEASLQALHRRLGTLRRLRFLTPKPREDSIQRLLEFLERGTHVVLEFGRYGRDLTAYILVANLLTRRIHARYVERTEEALGEDAGHPKPLVITIEEAHKFLNPEVADQTIFGTIAREMRKYNVTLLVIDQRPSAIDEEVMSQIGTKVCFLLDNERDIDGVLTGVSGHGELRAVLAKLESREQALLFGHALPMPVVVRTREYGSAESYRAFGQREAAEARRSAQKDAKDLWG